MILLSNHASNGDVFMIKRLKTFIIVKPKWLIIKTTNMDFKFPCAPKGKNHILCRLRMEHIFTVQIVKC
jgi:hypothetical protein